jgi:hypothetical protein
VKVSFATVLIVLLCFAAYSSKAQARTSFADGNKTIPVLVAKGMVTRVVFPEYIKNHAMPESNYLDIQIHGPSSNALYVMPQTDHVDQVVWVNTLNQSYRLHIKSGADPDETIQVVGPSNVGRKSSKVNVVNPGGGLNPYDCLIRELDNGPACPGASARDLNTILIDDGFIRVRARKGLSLGTIMALEAEVSLKKNMTLYLPGHAWPFRGAKRTSMLPERLFPQPGHDKGSLILVWDERDL